jgi:hypothetical protein
MSHAAPLGLENTLNDQVYKHVAPLALDALQAEVDALKRLQAGTAAELDALLPAIPARSFKGEL